MYLRKGSQLVYFIFPFSLIKNIKDQVGYQVKDSVKSKSDLSSNLEYLFQKASACRYKSQTIQS